MNALAAISLFLVYAAVIGVSIYLSFKFVFAVVRMSRAAESLSRSLEVIAAKFGEQRPPQQ